MIEIKINQDNLGEKLRLIRTALNLNQQEFSDKLSEGGYKIAKVTFRQIETNMRRISDDKYLVLTNTIKRTFSEELEKRGFTLDIEI